MARGWESKVVEEQESEEERVSQESTESGIDGIEDPAARRRRNIDLANRKRQKQELDLQRERILAERTSSPVRRAALEAALTDIESRLALLT